MEEGKLEQNLNDLIEIVGYLKDNMATKADITDIRADITDIRADITGVRADITGIKADITGVRSGMVTKSYLDDKLADQAAEIGDRINRAVGKQKDFNAELIDGMEIHNLLEVERIEKLKSLTV